MPEVDEAITAWTRAAAADLLARVEVSVEVARSGPSWTDDLGRATAPMFLRHHLVLDLPHTAGDNESATLANELGRRLEEAAERDPTLGGAFRDARVERDIDNERNPWRRPGFRRLVMAVVQSGPIT